ncbi:MAG: rRNA maturation RNase YbeY [Clostridia bacterium]
MGEINIDLDVSIVSFIENCHIDLENSIKKIVELIIDNEKIRVDVVSVSIQSASKDEIREINKEYRNIDNFTDVLSFPIFSKDELTDIILQRDEEKQIKELELGDIILCLDVIKEHSIEYNTGMIREVLYMITHGMCHLCGYDHIENEDKIKMRKIEENILSKIGVDMLNE